MTQTSQHSNSPQQRRVYLDWAATAPLCEEAAQAMAPYDVGGIGNIQVNANGDSLHSEGRKAFAAVESARADVASCIGARPDEIVFTSGATEANNAAIYGLAEAARLKRQDSGQKGFTPHVITSIIEHDAIELPVHTLKKYGYDVTFLPVDSRGMVSVDKLKEALRPETVLVSIMAANNEMGAIQNVKELAAATHAAGAVFHTDAVQALGKMPIDVNEWDVDAMTISSHKICGPEGVGALYLRSRVPYEPFIVGGGQESGMRSGTQNVQGIVGFAAACKALCGSKEDLIAECDRERAIRDMLYQGLLTHPQVHQSVPCTPGSTDYLPTVVDVVVDGIESNTLILRADMLGFAISGGSACSSDSLGPSRVLQSLGFDANLAQNGMRLSIGRLTTEDDARAFLDAFDKILHWNRF